MWRWSRNEAQRSTQGPLLWKLLERKVGSCACVLGPSFSSSRQAFRQAMSSGLPSYQIFFPKTTCWTYSLLLTMVGPTSRCYGIRNGPDTHSKVWCITPRMRCRFYKPEYDSVLKRCGELKGTGRLLALSVFQEERKIFVQQSFEVRMAEPPVIIARLLTTL